MTKSKTSAIGAIFATVMMISVGSLYLEDNVALAQQSSSDSDDDEKTNFSYRYCNDLDRS